VIAFDVRHYDSIGSTNDEALRLARDGAAHGTVVHADEQTAGRGRLARRWQSPPGNLYVSVVLRPNVPAARCVELGFVAALAVADAVETLLPNRLRTTLKWPNDVLLHDGKISGILLEKADDILILGIGINVLQAPGDVAYKTSTIVDCGGLATVDGSRASLLAALAKWFEIWQRDGFAPIRAAWLGRAHPAGTPLRVTLGDQLVEGRFADLASDGSLILETDDGRKQFVAGDVALIVRAAGPAAPPGAAI
jgi:BirA family transcriptional regulator, biotin operon repressor / biotin---[acetyl-CoA-carboxylase] ligase